MAKKKVEKEANDDRLDLIMKALGSKSEAFTADTKESITHTISSGLPDLDQMLTPIRVSEGKSGGLPRGKVAEFYGPNSGGKSSLSMRFAAQVTKNGGYVYWVDAESSFVREWAEAQGVILKNMVIEPAGKHGEYYLEKVVDVAKSKSVDLIVLDSITVMQPYEVYTADSEVDEKKGKITDTRVGSFAKMMNRFMPKVLGAASEGNCAIIFINQIRQKIGVIYGCFHEDTQITFVNGKNHTIRKVVENKMTGPIMSFNIETNKFEEKNITNWFDNGIMKSEEKWITVKSMSPGIINGCISFTCTENHNVLTERGYIPAKELMVSDKLISYYESTIENNEYVKDIIYGSLLGDGMIFVRSKNTGSLHLQNGQQNEYIDWKTNKLSSLNFKKLNYVNREKSRIRYSSSFTAELSLIKNKFYDSERFNGNSKNYRLIPDNLKLTPLMMAVWYMDDGHFDESDYHNRSSICMKRMANLKPEYVDFYKLKIKNLFSDFLETNLTQEDIKINYKFFIQFNAKTTRLLHSKIKEFIIPSMQYKLIEEFRGRYVDFNVLKSEKELKVFPVEILSITEAMQRKYRSRTKWDIEVDGCNNYLVGNFSRGVVVHNSNETTPGGESLKFAASIRLRVCRVTDKEGKGIKKDGEEIGIRSQVKLVKSRMGPPEKEVIVPIYFDESVKPHPLDCLIDMALSTKTVKSRSKKQDNGDPIQTFTYEDISCIGIDEFKSELSDDHIKDIYSKIIATGHVFPDDVIAYIKEIGGDEETSLPTEINESDPGE